MHTIIDVLTVKSNRSPLNLYVVEI